MPLVLHNHLAGGARTGLENGVLAYFPQTTGGDYSGRPGRGVPQWHVSAHAGHWQTGSATFELMKSCPNPFNGSSNIGFRNAEIEHESLTVYVDPGRQVATLNNVRKQSDAYAVQFDGGGLAGGACYHQIEAGNIV